MQKALIAAILASVAATAAPAQVTVGTCYSGTLSELAACAAANDSARQEAEDTFRNLPDAGGAEAAAPQGLQPGRLGGALQPSNLRAGGPAPSGAVAPRRANDVPVATNPRTTGGLAAYGGSTARSPIVSYQPLR